MATKTVTISRDAFEDLIRLNVIWYEKDGEINIHLLNRSNLYFI